LAREDEEFSLIVVGIVIFAHNCGLSYVRPT